MADEWGNRIDTNAEVEAQRKLAGGDGGAAATAEAGKPASSPDGGGSKAGGLHGRRKPNFERKGTVGKGGGARGGPSVKWEAVTARLDGLSTGGQLEALSEDGGTWGGCSRTGARAPLLKPPC